MQPLSSIEKGIKADKASRGKLFLSENCSSCSQCFPLTSGQVTGTLQRAWGEVGPDVWLTPVKIKCGRLRLELPAWYLQGSRCSATDSRTMKWGNSLCAQWAGWMKLVWSHFKRPCLRGLPAKKKLEYTVGYRNWEGFNISQPCKELRWEGCNGGSLRKLCQHPSRGRISIENLPY